MRKVLIGLGILALAAGVFAPAFGAELAQADRTFGWIERERRVTPGSELLQGEGASAGDASADAAAEAAAAGPGDSGNSGESCSPR